MDLVIYTGIPTVAFLIGIMIGQQLKEAALDKLSLSFASVLAHKEAETMKVVNEVCAFHGHDLQQMSAEYVQAKQMPQHVVEKDTTPTDQTYGFDLRSAKGDNEHD